jgi:arylsulfatase
LKTDPFEQADVSGDIGYNRWRADRLFVLAPIGSLVAQWMQTLMEFPPRQSPESWSPNSMLEKLKEKAEALKRGVHQNA